MDTTTDDTSRAGHVPPPPPARPPLRRRRDDRILGGVAGGIADHLGVDVALVRIVLVVLGLLNGLGVLLYLIAWVAVPEVEHGDAPEAAPPAADPGGRNPLFWVGVGLLVLGALALVTGPLALLPGASAPELLVPLVLIGFGLALWRAGDDDRTRVDVGPPPPPPARHGTAAATNVPTAASTPGGGVPPAQTVQAEAAGPAPGPEVADAARVGGSGDEGPRTPQGTELGPPDADTPRTWVTRATLGLVLVVVGLLWVLQLAGIATVGVATMLAVALLLLGLGLLVGSVVGGGRWLLLAGGLLLPLVLLAQATGPGMTALISAWDAGEGGRAVGQYLLAPGDLDELESSYRLGAGSLELDLTGVEFEEPAAVEVEVGAGQIVVTVPEDVEVAAVGQAGIGQVELFAERFSGGIGAGPIRGERTPEPSAGSLELDLSAGVGQVVVTTAPAP